MENVVPLQEGKPGKEILRKCEKFMGKTALPNTVSNFGLNIFLMAGVRLVTTNSRAVHILLDTRGISNRSPVQLIEIGVLLTDS